MSDTAILDAESVETADNPPDGTSTLSVASETLTKQAEYEAALEREKVEAEEAAEAKIAQEAALAEIHANTPAPVDQPALKSPGEAPLELINRRGRRRDKVLFPSDIAALAILATYRLSDRFTDEHDNEAQRQADGSVRLSIKQRGTEGGHMRVYVRVPDVVELSVVDGPDSTV